MVVMGSAVGQVLLEDGERGQSAPVVVGVVVIPFLYILRSSASCPPRLGLGLRRRNLHSLLVQHATLREPDQHTHIQRPSGLETKRSR